MNQTMPCPVCKKEISLKATTCPGCGHPISGQDVENHQAEMKFKGIAVIAIALAVFIWMMTTGDKAPDVAQAVAYQVVDSGQSSPGGRKRAEATIVAPTATTRDQFAQTAMKAALDLEDQTGAKVVTILLEPTTEVAGHGAALAIARHSEDGGGYSGDQGWKWQVEAAENRPSEQAIMIERLWYGNRDKFQIPDGAGGTMTDEDALSLAIANHMKINVDDVRLLYSERTKYVEE